MANIRARYGEVDMYKKYGMYEDAPKEIRDMVDKKMEEADRVPNSKRYNEIRQKDYLVVKNCISKTVEIRPIDEERDWNYIGVPKDEAHKMAVEESVKSNYVYTPACPL